MTGQRVTYKHPHPRTTSERDLATRSGQQVEVIRPLDPSTEVYDPEVGPMFLIEFDDGHQASAFADELTPTPEEGTTA